MRNKEYMFVPGRAASKLFACIGVCLVSLLIVDQALASLVSYTQDRRSVTSFGSTGSGPGNYFNVDSPSAPFDDWVDDNQISSMNALGFSAEGSGFGSRLLLLGGTTSNNILSRFDITFFTPEAVNLAISGILTGINNNAGTDIHDARFSLFSGDSTLDENLLYRVSVNAGTDLTENATVDFTSLLAPGEYRVVAMAGNGELLAGEITNSVESSYSISASFSAVPVPAAIWLFGTAMIGFVGYSHRRKIG